MLTLDRGQWEPSAAMSCSWQAFLADNPISSLLPPPQKFSLIAQGTWAVLIESEEMGRTGSEINAWLFTMCLLRSLFIW